MRSMNNLVFRRLGKELHAALGRAPPAPGEPMSLAGPENSCLAIRNIQHRISRHHKPTLMQEHGIYTLN